MAGIYWWLGSLEILGNSISQQQKSEILEFVRLC